MMTDDIHSLSGAYAVDALTADERAAFEDHLEHCAACRDEVDSLGEAAGQLSLLTAEEPPPSLREEVLGLVATVRPEPPRVNEAAPRRRPWTWLAAAAAAVVVALGIGIGITEPWDTGSDSGGLTVAEQIERAEDVQRLSVSFDDGARATVVRSENLGRAVIETSDMPQAPAGRRYVLWLQDPQGQMRNAGAMPADPGDTTLEFRGDAGAATAAGITIESDPAAPAPTSEPIALFPFA